MSDEQDDELGDVQARAKSVVDIWMVMRELNSYELEKLLALALCFRDLRTTGFAVDCNIQVREYEGAEVIEA